MKGLIGKIISLGVLLVCAGACGGINSFDTPRPVYYTVTAIHIDPPVVHVADVVTLSQTHGGSYNGPELGLHSPSARWTVDQGYLLDATWSEKYGPMPQPGFDPHVAQCQEIDRYEPPHWLAPAEPGPVHITCLYLGAAPDTYCVPLTVEVEVLPAE